MSDLYWLTDAQMERLQPFFPKSRGKARVDDLKVLSGIIFINRNGLRWRDAPAAYGPPKTLYNRWVRWSRMGVFARMLTELAAEGARTNTVMMAAGADEALMLDPRGFVASCNSTNFFVVRGGEVWTSAPGFSFRGITQATVLRAAREAGIPARETDFTLAQVYAADEAFVTGTLGGVTPVVRVDGRVIGTGRPGPMTARLAALYASTL